MKRRGKGSYACGRRGEAGDNVLMNNVIYLVIFFIFLVPMMIFAGSQRDGAAKWEDFYAKEIARIVDLAEPGSEVYLDVTKALEIGEKRKGKNALKDPDLIFRFDNDNGIVTVSLREGASTSFRFVSDVQVANVNYDFSLHVGKRLKFKIKEK